MTPLGNWFFDATPHDIVAGPKGVDLDFWWARPSDVAPQANAKVHAVLNLMDQVGLSVLDGTLYQQSATRAETHEDGEDLRSRREALVELYEAADATKDIRADSNHAVAYEPTASEPTESAGRSELVSTLREAARRLGQTAELLEEQNLYFRADELRELAQQLRQEARSALGGWSLEPLHSVEPTQAPEARRDLELEIEELRLDLRRTREALKTHPLDRSH